MVPKVVEGSREWARFEDWFCKVAGRYQDWTVTAELGSDEGIDSSDFFEKRACLSYLIPATGKSVQRSLDHNSWDVQWDLGAVSVEETDGGVMCRERAAKEIGRVFITLRREIGTFPAYWRLWPAFEDYFDLRYDDQGDLVDPYSAEVVAQLPAPANGKPVRIRTDYLQDYLAARRMLLIRQHDHRRQWREPIKGIVDRERNDLTHRETWGCWYLDVRNAPDAMFGLCRSRLVAKDIVTPYDVAGRVGGKRRKRVAVEDLPEFITWRELNGTEERRRPDPRDIVHPAFFNPKVLKRYYDEPSRYTVGFHAPGYGCLSFLDRWSIAIGRNEEGLIVLWLGDLVKERLPYEEINHWHVHNVPPRGGMATDFWNAQMCVKPPDTPSLEYRLTACRHALAKTVESLGKQIWRRYEGPDQVIEKTLRIPLFDEHSEFRDAVAVLARVFVEYLDHSSFNTDLQDSLRKDQSGKALGSIGLVHNWLRSVLNVPVTIAGKVKEAFQQVQMLRSEAGVAHRFSDAAYKRLSAKLGLRGSVSGRRLYVAVAEGLADALEALATSLGADAGLYWVRRGPGRATQA